jgi:hypothetical protein
MATEIETQRGIKQCEVAHRLSSIAKQMIESRLPNEQLEEIINQLNDSVEDIASIMEIRG